MKLNDLVGKAEGELNDSLELGAVALIKESLSSVRSARKTLRLVEEKHRSLLDSELEDLELDGYVY